MTVKLASDWQPVDVITKEHKILQGVWVDNEFLDLDNACKYGTMWMGPAPDCKDTEGNVVNLSGVYYDYGRRYLFEVDDREQQIRVWEEVA